MRSVEQAKQDAVEQLIAQIHNLKIKVDEKHGRATEMGVDIEAFMAQYRTFVLELDNQRHELERQIQSCRYRIRHFHDQEADTSEDQLDVVTKDEEPPETPEPDRPSVSPDPELSAISQEKQQIRHYFARHWHPDRSTGQMHPIDGLMSDLNVAFDKSQDVAEMLTLIPWHPVWVERQTEEPIGAQWERLVGWHVHLREANERLTRRLQQLEQDWRYPLCQAWKAAPNSQDYFADLASHERREIRRLEETLVVLRRQLSQMERHARGNENC